MRAIVLRSSLVVQQIEDPALSLLWLWSLLWLRFDPWPRNFLMPRVWPPKKNKKKQKNKKKREREREREREQLY